MLRGPANHWIPSHLDPHMPNWTHAIVIRRVLLRDPNSPIIPGRLQITRPAGRYEHIEIPTTCGTYVYFFMLVRPPRTTIDTQNRIDTRIMQYCDEVVTFKSFYPVLDIECYDKCRSYDPSQFTRNYARDKFVQDFLDRTAIR